MVYQWFIMKKYLVKWMMLVQNLGGHGQATFEFYHVKMTVFFSPPDYVKDVEFPDLP